MTVKRIDVFTDGMSFDEMATEKRHLADTHHLTDVTYLGRQPRADIHYPGQPAPFAFAFIYTFEGTQLLKCEGCEEWLPELNHDVVEKFSLCDPCKEREEVAAYEPDPDEAYEMRVDDQLGVG